MCVVYDRSLVGSEKQTTDLNFFPADREDRLVDKH